jgi:hypothetical protein
MNDLEKRIAQLLAEGSQSFNDRNVDAALQSFRKAIEEAERGAGPETPLLIRPLWSAARAVAWGHYEPCPEVSEAVRLSARATTIAGEHWSAQPYEFAMLLTNYAYDLRTNGQPDDAVAQAIRARDILLGIGQDARMQASHIVSTLMFANRGEEAVPYAREFLRMVEQAGDGVLLSHAHYLLTNCLRLAGMDEEALARAKQYVEDTGEHAANEGWKDVVRPMITELEDRIRSKG